MHNLLIIYLCTLVTILISNKNMLIQSEFIDTSIDEDARISNISAYMCQWAASLSQELNNLNKLTRRDKIEKSFQEYSIHNESWEETVEVVANNIRRMMIEKKKAVQAIKQHAELLSKYRKEDLNKYSHYDYYDANNISTDYLEDRTEDIKSDEKLWKCSIPPNVNQSRLCFENSYSYQSYDVPHEYASTGYNAFDYNKHNEDHSFLGRCGYSSYRPDGYYRKMAMKYHPHFNTAVNLKHSIVRVTPTANKRGNKLLNEIRWSEALDLTFKCNFQKDPSLTYQYFGSLSGFMRYYPAFKWSEETYNNSLDFRVRSWYIESFSSAKDIIILLDRSGSMLGHRRIVANEIVNSILDTLTDNDHVNIYTFNNSTEPLVDCFKNKLVGANEENLRLLREQLRNIKDEFYGNISIALHEAFPILWNYRKGRRHCNQAIMLITEDVDYEYDEGLYDKYNHLPDHVYEHRYYRPIRVFTYLLGTDVKDVKMMKWIACSNMGYYVNINHVAEVREKVLKYLEVLSRPINFNGVEVHPRISEPEPAWTALYAHLADRRLSNWLWKKHQGNKQRQTIIAYAKENIKDEKKRYLENTTHFTQQSKHENEIYEQPRNYQYLTTVSLPVYDLRVNSTVLLGVAAVDVPLQHIKQLAEPHMIGVNGYSFAITNNGYVLYHPDHRKEFADHILKPTFNSVDVTEVEISDNTNEPRNFDRYVKNLREEIVLQKKGHGKLNIRAPIDDMRRVMLHSRYYFYTKIEPFTLVIALPGRYGFYVCRMQEVSNKTMDNRIKRELRKSLKKHTDWRVNPNWLYTCNITRSNKNAEKELLHFLYTNTTDCTSKEQYIVNSLLQDMYVTEWWHNNDSVFQQTKQKKYHKGVVLTFMATHTGLTRCKDIKDQRGCKRFFDKHNQATDEIYFRRGAELNYNESFRDVFIFSVPFDDYNEGETLITASNVIFLEREGKRAPIAAVGYQILHKTLNNHLQTFTCKESPCEISCVGSDAWSCYVVDNDGYIILSNNTTNIGKSLAVVDHALMKTLVNDNVFKEITMFDYQAVCFKDYISKETFYGPTKKEAMDAVDCKGKSEMECKTINYMRLQLTKTTPTPCDKLHRLYNYQFRSFAHLHTEQNHRDCPCPYITEPIKGTNMLLVALDKYCCDMQDNVVTNEEPKEIVYKIDCMKYPEQCSTVKKNQWKYKKMIEDGNTEMEIKLPCYIEMFNNFTKDYYTNKCIKYHIGEFMLNQNQSYCGGESKYVPFV